MSAAAVKASSLETKNLVKPGGTVVHGNEGHNHSACGGRGSEGPFELTDAKITCKRQVCLDIAKQQQLAASAQRKKRAVASPFEPEAEAAPARVLQLAPAPAEPEAAAAEPAEVESTEIEEALIAAAGEIPMSVFDVSFGIPGGATYVVEGVQAYSLDDAERQVWRRLRVTVARRAEIG